MNRHHQPTDFLPAPGAAPKQLALCAMLACVSLAATAHDSWLEAQTGPRGERLLALGTGNQFPVQETAIGREYLTVNGCERAPSSPAVNATGAAAKQPPPPSTPSIPALSLGPLRYTDTALLMAVPPGATQCWLQLQTFDVTVPADKVTLYFKEINPPAEVRDTWARWQARGLPWRETYTKHTRALLTDETLASPGDAAHATSANTLSPAPGPSPLGMDLRLLPTRLPLRVGDTITVEVQRDGQPLPGQTIELRGDRSPLGIWRRSDAQGRISVTLPLAGRWVLRGVDLRVSTRQPDTWDSRFITFTFDVNPAPTAAATTK